MASTVADPSLANHSLYIEPLPKRRSPSIFTKVVVPPECAKEPDTDTSLNQV